MEIARIIVPVWGAQYLERLNSACMPALLAPGNLPHLARHYACELVIVTESSLFEAVGNLPSIGLAGRYAQLRLVALDDVLSHPRYYGLTLTHAFYRGLGAFGAEETPAWYLFLNADFILADGSYVALADRMSQGERCILAPSYCAIEEEVKPALDSALSQGGGILAIAPRQMANLILEHRHFTIWAKTINRRMYHIDRVDQFYYFHDRDTLLGRQLPIAIVAMRPERTPLAPVTFWDYGAISEFCPTTSPCVLGDSDDFLMLELRRGEALCGELRLGWMDEEVIARDLSLWTTKDQRACGEHTLVLHREDLPPDYEQGVEALGAYFRSVMRRVAPIPRDHKSHYIWTGVEALHDEWLHSQGRGIGQNVRTVREVALPCHSDSGAEPGWSGGLTRRALAHVRQGIFDALRKAYLALYGRPPDLGYLHPHYADVGPVVSALESIAGDRPKILGIASSSSAMIIPFLDQWGAARVISVEDIEDKFAGHELDADGQFEFCLAELSSKELLRFGTMYNRLRPRMKVGAKVLAHCRLTEGEPISQRSFDLIANGLPNCDIGDLEWRGNWFTVWIQRYWEAQRRKVSISNLGVSIWRGIICFVLSLLAFPLTLLSNRRLGTYRRSCTSVLLRLTVI